MTLGQSGEAASGLQTSSQVSRILCWEGTSSMRGRRGAWLPWYAGPAPCKLQDSGWRAWGLGGAPGMTPSHRRGFGAWWPWLGVSWGPGRLAAPCNDLGRRLEQTETPALSRGCICPGPSLQGLHQAQGRPPTQGMHTVGRTDRLLCKARLDSRMQPAPGPTLSGCHTADPRNSLDACVGGCTEPQLLAISQQAPSQPACSQLPGWAAGAGCLLGGRSEVAPSAARCSMRCTRCLPLSAHVRQCQVRLVSL